MMKQTTHNKGILYNTFMIYIRFKMNKTTLYPNLDM